MPINITPPNFKSGFTFEVASMMTQWGVVKGNLIEALGSINPTDPEARVNVDGFGPLSKEQIQAMLTMVNDFLKLLQDIISEEQKIAAEKQKTTHQNNLNAWT